MTDTELVKQQREGLLNALLDYRQADMDGIFVTTSRQAIEETVELVHALEAANISLLADLRRTVDETNALRTALATAHSDAIEKAAEVVRNHKPGWTAGLEPRDGLVHDKDGPWGLNSDFADAILSLKQEVRG